jgi:hypothetical protein
MLPKSLATSLKCAVIALVLTVFASSSFAAVDMFLQIEPEKGGKKTKVKVNDDGTFTCPSLPAGTYIVTLEWSWGATNANTSSGAGNGRQAKKASLSSTQEPGEMVLEYNVKSPRDAASGQASGKRSLSQNYLKKKLDKWLTTETSARVSMGSWTLDQDCDGITGSLACKDKKGEAIEIESFSWGVSNSSSR